MEYIEPCCVGRLLQPLLVEMQVVPFQTNGDVTLEKLMKGLSEFAGDKLTITLVSPTVDLPMMRMLQWYHRRGWLTACTIMTKDDQTEFIKNELQDMDLTVLHSDDVTGGMLVMEGEKKTIAVQGEILGEVKQGHYNYTAAEGTGTTSQNVLMLTETLAAQIRAAKRKTTKKTTKKTAKEETDTKEESDNRETTQNDTN